MTRTLAAKIASALIGHAASDKYPTRTSEYMLSWIMIAWSTMLLMSGVTLHGTQFVALLAVMPGFAWGIVGLIVGSLRIYALIRNGSWRKSPWLRLFGASLGFQFWSVVIILNIIAFIGGAFVYPIFGVFFVFAFFEAYSCFRCGQDGQRISGTAT